MGVVKQFEQTYYTSSATGLTQRPGLQTKAASKGIGPETRRLIEAFVSGYRLPPTSDRNVEEGQPVSLKSFSVGRDAWCVSLTHYRKFDWDRRIGSFFAHNLVCSARDFVECDANPFLLLHGFKKDDEGTDLELPLLPVELRSRPIEGVLEALRRAVGERARLAQLLDALLASQKSERPVVIVAAPSDVMTLVEGAITVMPKSIRAALSFSTFEASRPPTRIESPRVPGATTVMSCSGTTATRSGGSVYTSEEVERSYFVFDWEGGRFSTIPSPTRFADWMARKVFDTATAEVGECVRFLSVFDIAMVEIDAALALFLLPTAAGQDDGDQVTRAIAFAESRSDSVASAAASVERLLSVPAGSTHELHAVPLALELAARVDDATTAAPYERFRKFVGTVAKRGHASAVASALKAAERLPLSWQLRTLEDLQVDNVAGTHLVDLVAAVLRSGRATLQGESLEALTTSLVGLLNQALDSGDAASAERILAARAELPLRQRVSLAFRLRTTRGIRQQIPLLEEVIGLPDQDEGGATSAQLRQRTAELLDAAMRARQPVEAQEVVVRLVSALSQRARPLTIQQCLADQFQLLAHWLRGSDATPHLHTLTTRWIELLLSDVLEDESPATEAVRRELGSREPRLELQRYLTSRIGDEVSVVHERRSGPTLRLLVRSQRGDDYVVACSTDRIQLSRRDAVVYATRLRHVLELLRSLSFEDRTLIWSIVRTELDQGRVGFAEDVIQPLCAAIRLCAPAGDAARLVEDGVVPLLTGRADRPAYVPFLLEALSGTNDGGAAVMRRLDLSLAELRTVSAQSSSSEVFELYWARLGGGKDRDETIQELVDLYQAGSTALFQRAAIRLVEVQKGLPGATVRDLLAAVPEVCKDEAMLSALLTGCRKLPGRDWTDVVTETDAFARDAGSPTAVRAVAHLCVAGLRDALRDGVTVSAIEADIVDRWLEEPGLEDPMADAAAVFREVGRLRLNGRSPSVVVAEDLEEFQKRKRGLAARDYLTAANRVLRVFADCEPLASPDVWDAVERVASHRGEREPLDEFRGLVKNFFDACALRRDYAELLALVTVRMIRHWRDYEPCRDVLRAGYRLLDGRKTKAAYAEAVTDALKGVVGRSASDGETWWRSQIDQPDDRSLLDKLLGTLGVRRPS